MVYACHNVKAWLTESQRNSLFCLYISYLLIHIEFLPQGQRKWPGENRGGGGWGFENCPHQW